MSVYDNIEHERIVKSGKLDISHRNLLHLPFALTELTWLTSLDASGNRIKNLQNLPQGLTSLKIDRNKITEIDNLPQGLVSLNISSNDIGKIENLPQNLTELEISQNNIGKLENLPRGLRSLIVSGNKINKLENLPEVLMELEINFNNINKLENLPPGLTKLMLRYNKICTLENLPKGLKKLNLVGNLISDLTPLISFLSKGQISMNKLNAIDDSSTLFVGGNPLTTPPPEIVEKGTKAVLRYFDELKKGKDYLFEAKLLIVGEPGAGKTTLFRKLKDSSSVLPLSEETTKGIDIHMFMVRNRLPGKTDFRVNLWDFGGQAIYHATHQFFLTKRSLYVLVTDGRKENTDFNYWLQVVELLSGSSPVIIVQNEKDGRKPDVDLRGLQERFNSIKELHSLDLSRDFDNIQKLKDSISHFIQQLDHVGQEIPRQWVDVRRKLEARSRKVPFITREEYFIICDESGIVDKDTACLLSGYLHDIGSFLHFQEDAVLKKYLFLKNEWATDAVYSILDDNIIKTEQKGHFDQRDIMRILDLPEYLFMHDEVIQLMVKFELAYQIPDSYRDLYVVPQLLKVEKPKYEWDSNKNIYLTFEYIFLPKGLMSRLIARLHNYATNFDFLWRTGALFYRSDTRAEVVETYGERKISIRVEGKYPKELLTIITEAIEVLNNGYEKIEFEKKVPCNCDKCRNSAKPYLFNYSSLMKRLDHGKEKCECDESYTEISIARLLGDVFANHAAIKLTESYLDSHNPLNLFISYSKDNKDDLEMFRKALSPLRYSKKIVTWDDTDLVPTEEWNAKIKSKLHEADIIVFLTSIDSLATEYIWKEELAIAEVRYKKAEVLILPVILNDCLWQESVLANYTALPDKAKPIHSKGWDNEDQAWANVAKGILRLINEFSGL